MAATLSTALLLAHLDTPGAQDRAHQLILESRAIIARLDAQIADLEHLRAREHRVIAALQLITAPVRTIPVDVLGKILALAVDVDGPVTDVLVFGQVCKHWRDATLKTPRLWCRMLPIPSAKRPGEVMVDATKVFLERSAPLPFPISLDSGHDSSGKSFSALMDVLFAVTERWQSLAMTTKSLPSLAQIPTGSLRVLETLDIRHVEGAGKYPSINAFATSTLLRRVTLFHVPVVTTIAIPWWQLTHIALAHESPQLCLDIVVRCTHAQSVTLRVSGWPTSVDHSATVETVTLPRLEELEIHISNTSSDEHFTPFLRRLVLPELKLLKLYGEYNSGVITWSPDAFTTFQRNSPHISHLQIDHCALTSEDLLTVAQHGSNVTRLEVYNCSNCIDDAFLASLRYSSSSAQPPALPRLEVLWLSSQRCDFEEATLKMFVESRWWTEEELAGMPERPSVSRLNDVRYSSSRKFSRKFEKRMEVFRVEGLQFRTSVI